MSVIRIMWMSEAVAEYQCAGCMNGSDPDSCESADVTDVGCKSHRAGTMGLGSGLFALGLPKGFNRFGPDESRTFEIFETYDAMIAKFPNLLTIFSLPIWKHLDQNGNTIVRWFSPRTNVGWSCVIIGDCMEKFPNALEITNDQIDDMD